MNKRSSSTGPGARPGGASSARLEALVESWERSLRARNLAENTRASYLYGIRAALAYWAAQPNGPRRVGEVAREHIEAFQVDMLATGHKASSVATYHRCVHLFLRWCVEEEEIPASPMALVKAPLVPDADAAPPVLSPAEVSRLLAACAGNGFYARRDGALLLLMFDTGVRRQEVMQLACADVDLGEGLITVHRKGRRLETLPLSSKTVRALDRYLRVRAQHKSADNPAFWLGRQGALHTATLYRIIEQRATAAGLPHIWPHVTRHTFASNWLEAGGQEGDLMQLAGWRSRTMLGRYGRRMAQRRARDAHKRLAPGDQY